MTKNFLFGGQGGHEDFFQLFCTVNQFATFTAKTVCVSFCHGLGCGRHEKIGGTNSMIECILPG
jgi:hypothetical protein